MSLRVLIIDGKEPNAGVGGVSAADFSHFSNRFLTPGVVGTDDFKVEAQDTPDMSVKYAPGKAYVPNPAGDFNIPVDDDTGGNVPITSNTSGNDRIDTIVIAIGTEADPNEFGDNIAEVVAVPGEPASSPSPLTDNEIQTALGAGFAFLKLTEVTVENGTVSITGADVSDVREEVTFTLVGGIPVTRQDNTTNSEVEEPVIITGWGYVAGNSVAEVSDTAVNFGVTFAQKPIVTITFLGHANPSPPTDPTSQFSDHPCIAMAFGISTTGFTPRLRRMDGSNTNPAAYYMYTWTAIGKLAS